MYHRFYGEPFFASSRAVLKLCEDGKISGFLSASTVTDIFCLSHRFFHNNDEAYKVVGHVLDIAKVLSVTNDNVLSAYMQRASDFEDCLLAVCAKANHCAGIIARNKEDFKGFDITVVTPDEFLARETFSR